MVRSLVELDRERVCVYYENYKANIHDVCSRLIITVQLRMHTQGLAIEICLSVCLSVCQSRAHQQNEIIYCQNSYTI